MAYTTAGGRVKRVKNLGWLRRHWRDVDSFDIKRLPHGRAHMTAHMTSGGRFETTWQSEAVLIEWLKRPSFRGVPVRYHD